MTANKERAVLGYGVSGHLATYERAALTSGLLVTTALVLAVVLAGLATIAGAVL